MTNADKAPERFNLERLKNACSYAAEQASGSLEGYDYEQAEVLHLCYTEITQLQAENAALQAKCEALEKNECGVCGTELPKDIVVVIRCEGCARIDAVHGIRPWESTSE